MQSIQSTLEKMLAAILQAEFSPALLSSSPHLHPEVMQVGQVQHGHYQCNNALKLAKECKRAPRDVAMQIASQLKHPMIAKVEIAGPGFINITIDAHFLGDYIKQMLSSPRLGVDCGGQRKKVIVEFSSPNIAKELHVGHLRSTIIGEALARLFEFLGHDVLRLNHVGDFGTQFGMLIAYLKEVAPDVLTGRVDTDLSHLMQWYKESKSKFDADVEFKKKAQRQVVELQSGDPLSMQAWQMICEISRRAFQQIYDLMDVTLIERGESFYSPYLPDVVSDLDRKGLITISDGAKCVFLEGFVGRDGLPLPMIIQKSDGGYNYETTDMAALRHRVDIEKADRIIYVTDAGQSLHFDQVFKTAEKAGYFDKSRVQIDHVTFGVVLGPDGKKFKTRSGETEKLIDLLLEAVRRADKIVHERLPEISPDERHELALCLGIGAVKYADLSCHRVKDYVFSYDRMLRFDGNTAAFLLYAYVRIEGIKKKGEKNIADLLETAPLILDHPSELALALHVAQLSETLSAMAKDLLPSRLCEYLYALAEKFNAFYRDCRVDGDPSEASRKILCEAVSRTLSAGLGILGIKTVSRM